MGQSGKVAQGRVIYYDLLNIVACIGVVYLHSNAMVHTWVPGKNWILALGIECVLYWPVPIFFMLVGATLMRYRDRYDTTTFFRKRVLRTVVPFVAWSLIVSLIRNVPNPWTLRSFVSGMLSCTIEPVYWFFIPLFAIYLSLPALSWLADKKSTLVYLAIGSFVLQSVCPLLFRLAGIDWNGGLNITTVASNAMFVVIGYLLATEDIDRRGRWLLYAGGGFGLAVRFGYTLFVSEANGMLTRVMFDYTLFPSVMLAVAVFVWFKYHRWGSFIQRHAGLLAKISACSFGVYLIHKPLLDLVVFGRMGIPMTSPWFRLFGAFVFYLVCLAIVCILRKIPVLRRIVP